MNKNLLPDNYYKSEFFYLTQQKSVYYTRISFRCYLIWWSIWYNSHIKIRKISMQILLYPVTPFKIVEGDNNASNQAVGCVNWKTILVFCVDKKINQLLVFVQKGIICKICWSTTMVSHSLIYNFFSMLFHDIQK